jgi:hypothetical protein
LGELKESSGGGAGNLLGGFVSFMKGFVFVHEY